MNIRGFRYTKKTANHILKHNLTINQIKHALKGKKLVKREKKRLLVLCSYHGRIIKVVFEKKGKYLWLITAYDASDSEKRLYSKRAKS